MMVDDRTTLEFPSVGLVSSALCPPDGLVCTLAAGPGGHPLRVLLDTGTDPSAMDAGLARRLAVHTGGSGVGQGAASDEVAFTEAVLPWLRLGDAGNALVIRDLFAPAVDLSGLPFRVDVVLGYTVLRQLALRIDYRARAVTFAHPDLGLPVLAPEAEAMPLTFFEHFPALQELELDGVAIPLATIDTGSNAGLTVGPDLAAQLGLRRDASGVTLALGAGFGGGAEVIRRRYELLRVGPHILRDIELDAHLGDVGDLGRAGRANLGNRLLAQFAAVTLDYERRAAALERGS
ncbi:MAG: hypothetical protein RLZZ387_1680 [Chloroflexota bacterium]